MSDFLTDREVGDRLGISKHQVQARCRAGEWPHTRIGQAYRFTPEQYERIKALLAVEPKPATKAAPAAAGNAWGRKTRGSRAA